jgi:hypothetical protein
MKGRIKGGTKDIGRLLGNNKNAEAVVNFVLETGRLKWIRGEEKESNTQRSKENGQERSGEERG